MRKTTSGFTIVELLIVVVVIGILAAIVIATFNNVQARAQTAQMKTDIRNLSQAIQAARVTSQKTLKEITGNGYGMGGTGAACNSMPNGTDVAALPRTHSCWVSYVNLLETVSEASGINVRNIVDPWKRPYSIIELERPDDCRRDEIWGFTQTYSAWGGRMPGTQISIPFSGFTSCT